jgi:peptidoglycan hydrolase CwlO-like protein
MAPEDTPATKRDIRELELRITSLEERLLDRMRDMQTELLKAFLP